MSAALRIILVAVSLLTAIFVLGKIKKSQFVIGDTIYWLFFCLFLLVISIFPQIIEFCAKIMHIQSPANLVFLVIIFLLLVKVFALSVKISRLETRFIKLCERYAVDSHKDKE